MVYAHLAPTGRGRKGACWRATGPDALAAHGRVRWGELLAGHEAVVSVRREKSPAAAGSNPSPSTDAELARLKMQRASSPSSPSGTSWARPAARANTAASSDS